MVLAKPKSRSLHSPRKWDCTKYTYDNLGRRRTMVDTPSAGGGGQTTTYSYDFFGNITELQAPHGVALSFTYDGMNRQITKKESGGTSLIGTFTYDAAGQMTNVFYSRSGTTDFRITYTYDNFGNRTSANELRPSAVPAHTTWTYDKTYQILSEYMTRQDGPSINLLFYNIYSFDAAGNRDTKLEIAGQITTYTYDVANQLLTEKRNESEGGPITTITYTYDNAGQRTQKNVAGVMTYFSWDSRGRLSVVEPVAGKTTYTYGPVSQRTEKQAPTATLDYQWDMKRLLRQIDGTDDTDFAGLLDEYGHVQAMTSLTEATTFLYEEDALNNTLGLEDGGITDQYIYSAFGQVESHAGSTNNPHTFVGKQSYYAEPDLGLYLVGISYYDPLTGTWLRPDPAFSDTNRYRYAHNNPVNKTDPSGLDDDDLFGKFMAKVVSKSESALEDESKLWKSKEAPSGSGWWKSWDTYPGWGVRNSPPRITADGKTIVYEWEVKDSWWGKYRDIVVLNKDGRVPNRNDFQIAYPTAQYLEKNRADYYAELDELIQQKRFYEQAVLKVTFGFLGMLTPMPISFSLGLESLSSGIAELYTGKPQEGLISYLHRRDMARLGIEGNDADERLQVFFRAMHFFSLAEIAAPLALAGGTRLLGKMLPAPKGGLASEVATVTRNSAAQDLLAAAKRAEPKISSDLARIQNAAGGKFAGFDNRIKTLQSLEQKLGARGVSPENINDSLRYTITFSDEAFSSGANKVMAELESLGYEKISVFNSFRNNSSYKGVNSTFRAPDGQIFELQFHTPTSYEVKNNALHRQMYEEMRVLPRTNPRWIELNNKMKANSSLISNPPGVQDVR